LIEVLRVVCHASRLARLMGHLDGAANEYPSVDAAPVAGVTLKVPQRVESFMSSEALD